MIIKGKVLDAGKHIITNALIGQATSYASSFKVGDLAAFTFDKTEVAPRGTIVHQGSTNDIAVTRIANDTVRFVCSIPEGYGPFTMGNLVMYMEDENNDEVPFLAVAFPATVLKQPSNDQITTDGFTLPGTRFAVSIEIRHSDEETDVIVNILPPDYSSLPTFSTELDVPPASALTFKQFVINYHSAIKGPVLMTIDENNVRWAQPFTQQIIDPNFGQLDGGMDGEGWGNESQELVWGGAYGTLDSSYTENPVGGAAYTDTQLQTIGGSGYTPTVNEYIVNS